MGNEKNASRRNFIRQSSLGLGAGILGVSNPFTNIDEVREDKKIPGRYKLLVLI